MAQSIQDTNQFCVSSQRLECKWQYDVLWWFSLATSDCKYKITVEGVGESLFQVVEDRQASL